MRPRSGTADRAFTTADVRRDGGDEDAAKLLYQCSGEIDSLLGWLHRLSWAAVESNKRKRLAALELVRMEMEHQDMSTAFLPSRPLPQ